jgi:aspartate aminotransferase
MGDTLSVISDRANNLQESVTIKMAALATELKEKGLDVISLTLGEPDFNIPDFIKDAAKKAIDDNFSSYTPVPGLKDLRLAVVEKLKRDNGLDYTFDQVIVSTGAKQSLMNVVLSIVNPGDEVILPAPYWVSYIEMVKFAEGNPVVIDTTVDTGFKITKDQLESAINDKTKAFIFSNPCNPSGGAYTQEELADLASVFEKYPNCVIVSDEIYEYINFTGRNISMASFSKIKDQVVTVNGVSKGFAMTGWRIGYIAAPLDIAKACNKIQGQFTSGANAVAQVATITALKGGQEKVSFMKDEFLKRRNLMFSLLSEIKHLKVRQPEGAFYLFPDVSSFFGSELDGKKLNTSEDICSYLIEEALVVTTPGGAFGSPSCIRLSYATDEKTLTEAAKRMKKALEKLKS